MPTQKSCNLSSTGGMADHHGILEIELLEKLMEVVGVGIHIMAFPGLG